MTEQNTDRSYKSYALEYDGFDNQFFVATKEGSDPWARDESIPERVVQYLAVEAKRNMRVNPRKYRIDRNGRLIFDYDLRHMFNRLTSSKF